MTHKLAILTALFTLATPILVSAAVVVYDVDGATSGFAGNTGTQSFDSNWASYSTTGDQATAAWNDGDEIAFHLDDDTAAMTVQTSLTGSTTYNIGATANFYMANTSSQNITIDAVAGTTVNFNDTTQAKIAGTNLQHAYSRFVLSGDGNYTGNLTSDISVSLEGSTAFDGKITYNENSYGWNNLYDLKINNDAVGTDTDLVLNGKLSIEAANGTGLTLGNLSGNADGVIGVPAYGGTLGFTITQTDDDTYAGTIGANGNGTPNNTFNVVKEGSANLTLSSATGLTFDGALQVNDGILTLNGNWIQTANTTSDSAQYSDLQVNAGGTLAGTGSAELNNDHNITVDTAGTVAPGDGGIGTLTLDFENTTGTLLFDGTLAIEISDSSTDLLALTNGGTGTFDNATLWIDVLGSFQPSYMQTFDIVTADSLTQTGSFSLAGPDAAWFTAPQIVDLAGGGQAVRLTSVIPEPAAITLLGLGAALLLGRRRNLSQA